MMVMDAKETKLNNMKKTTNKQKKMKARIIERTLPSGMIQYVIQQRHFLFRWWWVDARVNSSYVGCCDTWYTIEEARRHLCRFDGTKTTEKVIALDDTPAQDNQNETE